MTAQVLVSRELPKQGSRIPISLFHISPTNVNFEEDFGKCQEDENLTANLKAGNKIIQPLKARPEGKGFGIYIGRRRFLAKKEAGFTFFVVGDDCLINNISEEEAEKASWIENSRAFQKGMNPISRAKGLEKIVSRCGLREYSRQSGISASSLSEYLSILELSPKMQNLLARGVLNYTDGVIVARLEVDPETQAKLAATLMTDGKKAFARECYLLKKKRSTKKRTTRKRKKRAKKNKHSDFNKPMLQKTGGKDASFHVAERFWRELTQSLREFSNYWVEYSTLKEWDDPKAFHLVLEVTVPKDLDQSNTGKQITE